MVDTEQQQPTYRFGVFELNIRRGELRKNGVRIRLQQQPLQILGILLERPGEVVTREEIQRKLWPDNTYVDFDNAINSSIRKIREALVDTAENPRFIETLSRRGYRRSLLSSASPADFFGCQDPGGRQTPVTTYTLPSLLPAIPDMKSCRHFHLMGPVLPSLGKSPGTATRMST
jgi:DNA-binding winged helix-turn-helix (wHTH) protein